MTTIDTRARLLTGLRRTAFATIVALLLEYGFGLFLFGTTPKSAHGQSLFVAFGLSIASGPVILIVHALFGSILVLGGVMSLVRAIQSRVPSLIALNAVGFAAILLAWLAGSATASDPMGPSGRVMGVMMGIAVLAYATILFTTSRAVTRRAAS
jgi:hypothetical protein